MDIRIAVASYFPPKSEGRLTLIRIALPGQGYSVRALPRVGTWGESAAAFSLEFAASYGNCWNPSVGVIFSASAFRDGKQAFQDLLATNYLRSASAGSTMSMNTWKKSQWNLSPCDLSGVARSHAMGIPYKLHDRSGEKALLEVPEMKKPRRKSSRLSKDASDHEIIRWTTPAMKRCSRSWPASAPRMQRLSLVSGWPSVWSGN